MKLLKDIEDFRDNMSGGYSLTSNEFLRAEKSIYVGLYDLVLQHIIGSDPDLIREELNKYLPLLEGGLLCERQDFISGAQHDSLYVALHVSSIYYQLVSFYSETHPPIDALLGISINDLSLKLDQLDYSDAWKVSNEIMSYAVLLAFNSEKGSSPDSVQWCLNYIKKKQDVDTGLWLSEKNKSLLNGVAATFHYLPLYDYLDEPVDFPDKLLEAVLSMRLPNGFFSSPAGYACIEYDCIAILFFLLKQHIGHNFISESNLSEISKTASKLRSAILRIQNADGGFPEFGGPVRPIVDGIYATMSLSKHHCLRTYIWNLKKIARLLLRKNIPSYSNSVLACGALPFESNAFATWFRYMTVSICEEILSLHNCEFDRVTDSRLFNLPGLGRL